MNIQDDRGNEAEHCHKNIDGHEKPHADPVRPFMEAPILSPRVESARKRADRDNEDWCNDEPAEQIAKQPKAIRKAESDANENRHPRSNDRCDAGPELDAGIAMGVR
jgi:hypothetical protein